MNIDKDIEILEELKEFLQRNDVEDMFSSFDEEIQAIENVLSGLEKYKKAYELETYERQKFIDELETWKKIAEKLAEHISRRCYYVDDYSNSCDVIEDSCFEDKDCKQCIIGWTRKEVEKRC